MGILDAPPKSGVRAERRRDLTRPAERERVMANPPTVTCIGPTTSNFTGIASPKFYSAANLLAGGLVTFHGGTPGGTALVNLSQSGQAPFIMEFMLLDTEVDLLLLWDTNSNSGASLRIKVDDEYVSLDPISPSPMVLANTYTSVRVVFPTRDLRKITFEMTRCSWSRLYTSTSGAISPVTPPSDVVAILGDSYTAGSVAQSGHMAWWAHTCRLLRWGQPWALGQGGTGFLNPSAVGGQSTYINRLTDVAASNADTLIISGGYNDKTTDNAAYTTSALGTAVTTLLAAIPTACPKVKRVYVVGPWQPTGSPSAALTAAANAVKTAALAAPNVTAYIDTTGWITGVGWAGVPKPLQSLTPTVAATGGGGAFASGGTFTYRWTSLTSRGETPAGNATTATVAANGTVTTYVGVVQFTSGYNVYRTDSGGTTVKVASAITSPTFTDTGVAGTAASPPTVDTSGNVDGSGSSGFLTASDGVHPVDDGHRWLGWKIAEAIRASLPA